MPQIKPSKRSPHSRSLGASTKKNEGSLRSQLRAMQRSNRRFVGGNSLDDKHIRPRDERIKRNHMQTVNSEIRMHNDMLIRVHESQGFVPISRYMIP